MKNTYKDLFKPVNELFHCLVASCNNYPLISYQEFSQFCKESGILDDYVNVTAFDLAFVSTNVELED